MRLVKNITLFLAILSLGACSLNPHTEWLLQGDRYGDRSYDPCIKCGENWIFIPQEPFHAQRQAHREGYRLGDPNAIAHY